MRYIIANWKMNLTLKHITQWVENFKELKLKTPNDVSVVLAPTAPYLGLLKELNNSINVALAAQDVSEFEKGAHTGEISATQLKDFTDLCIVGHSELQETRDLVLRKTQQCLSRGVTPICCFVELNDAQQLYKLAGDKVIYAWEDPSNISKNGIYNSKNTEDITKGVAEIRNIIGNTSSLIYGGSVNRQNARDLANIYQLNGVLVGQASTDPIHFGDIIKEF